MDIKFERHGDWYESLGDTEHVKAVSAVTGRPIDRTIVEGRYTVGAPYHMIHALADSLRQAGHTVTITE